MRIAIIGAGFFGHHIARQLRRVYPQADIDMFERESAALSGAGTKNQCRLHMGFHYPRSGYTIYQSIMGFDRFVEQYGEYLSDVGNNLYAVHTDGLVTVEQYLAVMDSFHLPYERLPVSPEYFAKPKDIKLLLRVPEKSINVKELRHNLAEQFDGKLYRSTAIDELDPTQGLLRSGKQEFGPYDYIINATYTDPNLGLKKKDHFEIKWEIAALVLARTSLPADMAVTIMDGDFVSVYPAYEGMHTLSSVAHTPMRRYTDYADLAADYPRRYELANDYGTLEAIGADVQQYLRFTYEAKDLWVTAKTKLRADMGDSRITEVRRNDRLLSVLCGKLDAVFEASDTILREIT
jgi:hypothetical protein